MLSEENLPFAFFLTLMAGLSTGIGGAVAFSRFAGKEKVLAFGLGFAAGAMIYISFFDLLFNALVYFSEADGEEAALVRVSVLFLGGMAACGLAGEGIAYIAKFFGVEKKKIESIDDTKSAAADPKKLYRAGIVTAVALAIHNIPEGLVTFITTLQDVKKGVGIAIAIAIHNIPEGMAVALPIYHATKNRTKALLITLIPAISEPLGALIAYLLFFRDFDEQALESINVVLASIMVYVSFFELLPTAYQLKYDRLPKWGLIAGLVVLALAFSILL